MMETHLNAYNEPPTTFRVNSEVITEPKLTSNEQICDLCSYPKKKFYCKKCIQIGDFHSKRTSDTERFLEKQHKLNNLRKAQNILENKFHEKTQKLLKIETLRSSITKFRNRNELLTNLISDKRQTVQKLQQKKKENHEKNRAIRIILPKYEDKVNQLGDNVYEAVAKNESKRSKLNEQNEHLKECRRKYIDELFKYIFPISQILKNQSGSLTSELNNDNRKTSYNDSIISETVNEISEAIRTAYVRGQWKQERSSSDIQYMIVAPILPSNGDYSAYCDWIAQNNKEIPPSSNSNLPGNDSCNVDLNPAYRISAALTYVSQLVQALSYYLDIRLPYKIIYSDFCTMDLNENQFLRKVARLNMNVLYLCFTQNVKMNFIQPQHTIENILMLLDTKVSDLGRTGAIDNSDRIYASINVKSITDLLESHNNSDSDNEDHMLSAQEWENVGPVHEITNSVMIHQHPNQTTSMAAGLMNTARNSLASFSFWRGWK